MGLGDREADERAMDFLLRVGREWGTEVACVDGAFGVPTREDHGDIYVYNWNSVAYIESGDIMDQLLIGPIAVPKSGDPVFLLGTAADTAGELRRWRARLS